MNHYQTLDIIMHSPVSDLDSGCMPIRKRIDLANNLYLDVLPTEDAEKVFEACEPKEYNHNPTRQYGQLYSFIRENPPNSDDFNWDEDQRLQLCLALSRLVHPTSISTEYAARIFKTSDGTIEKIIPGLVSGNSSAAFVFDTNSDYLTKIDAQNLRQLIEAFERKPLEDPLTRAMWYHEYAARSYEIDLRWTLIATGIEAIVHKDRNKSTKQFVERVQKLSIAVGVKNITENQAKNMYEFRSSLAHGQGLGKITPEEEELYKKMEDILRLTIQKSILEKAFRDFLSNPDQVRKSWPV